MQDQIKEEILNCVDGNESYVSFIQQKHGLHYVKARVLVM